MTTAWTTPTTIEQYAEADTHIAWNTKYFDSLASTVHTKVETVAPLFHIARSPKYDLIDKTWYMRLTGFNFDSLPDVISGISAVTHMDRGGRVVDETISLTYQGEIIGTNRSAGIMDPLTGASLLSTTTVYGGPTDMWEVKNLIKSMVEDPSFGIVLRYQSHPYWPHKTVPSVVSVQLQIS
jgi:hypothetical protein